ncbi:flagellar export chaperone FliS [Gilvimarinus agarilyticus]|uniref:flagellar export chaperone FliS n=1 Tax=unclassified Gilvimarinus TaxID=2642066 RepID=UPI001C09CE9E|nr:MULTISPECIES: flagellar export chaperone FliS [unclassified Gilvimarinus]MBU2887245.1 flagellar export chaperone FliS [Gilvimarinus agarilyticus]MDO6571904.1 flagellar export chaperone FliS [Gilvimarinus sp. 2_MG-2023]MDO6745973.1 flagellar export chaperone FliS [Gilvimarinus sp. 1_MG-2023]
MSPYSAAAKQYQQVNVQSSVVDASPHRLVQMLFEGALQRIAEAKGAMLRSDIALRGEKISKAINIVQGLQGSLNDTEGGDLSASLDQLYDYIARRLIEANRQSDPAMLDECGRLLGEIKTAWDGISAGPGV